MDPLGLVCFPSLGDLLSLLGSNPGLLALAVGSEIAGGGPEDPLADIAVAEELLAAEGIAGGADVATISAESTLAGVEATSAAAGGAGVADELVSVTHFTNAAGASAIGEGGMLNAGSFVTTSNLSGLSATEVDSALEIDAGKGAFSTTFQTAASNLGPTFNGPLTSGRIPQFQLINPARVTTFVPTPVGS